MALARSKDKYSSSYSSYVTTLSHPKPLQLLLTLLLFSIWLISFRLLFSTSVSSNSSTSSATVHTAADETKCDPDIATFYIVPLPSRFNSDLLLNCRSLSPYTDMCPHVSHSGLGKPLSPFSSSWHATHQFLAEIIFHARAELHQCRTHDPSSAELFLLPFYAGIYASSQFSQSNLTIRDSLALDFASLLPSLPYWPRRHGRDHFIVIGRTAWDFMRKQSPSSDSPDFGANPLLLLPEIQNISVLTVERHPWLGHNQFAIPYPSYFHPSAASELDAWRASILTSPRSHLFAFVGGPRPPNLEKAVARGHILRQCAAAPTRCLRVECRQDNPSTCHDPENVLAVMRRAEFCMQPPGDSFTRRSVFDAMLAGCIPVFFSENTAYTQYTWYSPARPEEWSVFLRQEQWARINAELEQIPKATVTRMRERVVEMIPRMTYAHPNASRSFGFRDAVDVALVELSKLVRPSVLPEQSV